MPGLKRTFCLANRSRIVLSFTGRSLATVIVMFVGIPTLNRYDLLGAGLERLAESSLRPTCVCIVDNGRRWFDPGGWPFPLWVIRPDRNLGVAASWNLFGRLSAPGDTIILNDDVLVAPHTLARMSAVPEPFVSVCDTPGFEARRDHSDVRVSDWSCFLQRRLVWSQVGDYDETFWPGGYEDTDYWRRMSLAGIAVMRLPEDGMRHRIAATSAAFSPSERRLLDEATARNGRHYLEKWGGPPGRERFGVPFNGEDEAARRSA